MDPRTDRAARVIDASPREVYQAFAEPGAMEQWMAPSGMSARMIHFDFRSGGSYRMRLTYVDPRGNQGKSTDDSDEVRVRLIALHEGKRIEQEVDFEADDLAFAGTMRMVWTFEPDADGARVTVRAENVPEGIRPADHRAGMNSTLDNLAAFLARKGG